jgi:aminobenzoyl-glutamate utilization protein B
MSIGHKGMLHAARALALSAAAIYTDPDLAVAIRAEFEEAMAGKTYQALIPDGIKPGK